MNKRWQIIVEITFDPASEKEQPSQALSRIKTALDELLPQEQPPIHHHPINHYHILQPPKYVHEFD